MESECLREGAIARQHCQTKRALSQHQSCFSPGNWVGLQLSLLCHTIFLLLFSVSLPVQICVFACYFLHSTLFPSVLSLQLEQKAPSMHYELVGKVLKRATGVTLTSQISPPPFALVVMGIIIPTPLNIFSQKLFMAPLKLGLKCGNSESLFDAILACRLNLSS